MKVLAAIVSSLFALLAVTTGQIATIVFAPGNSAADNAGFNQTVANMGNLPGMPNAQANFLNSSAVTVTVSINSTNDASVVQTGTSSYTMYLNNAIGTNYLSEAQFTAAVANGEYPPSRETTVSHEAAHVQGITNEADAVANYENATRSSQGNDARNTYDGAPVENTGIWASFANWWKSLWGSSEEGQPEDQDDE